MAAKIVQNYDQRHNLFQVESAENGKKNGTNGNWGFGKPLVMVNVDDGNGNTMTTTI